MVSLNPELEQNVLIEVAKRMCIAARTAPKANGKDFLITAILSGEELKPLRNASIFEGLISCRHSGAHRHGHLP